MKKIRRIVRHTQTHWVGDGFPVRTLFSYVMPDVQISPFLMLDFAGPAEFAPAGKPRGVGLHPHRGFETVTILYQGEVEHRDTAGHGGKIGPGDVQWMTAARGLLHEEMHSAEFTRSGGVFEAIQLWVNLPARHKADLPRYQEIGRNRIPEARLDGNGGSVRVIAGRYEGLEGPAETHTPINLWDVRLAAGRSLDLEFNENDSTILLVLKGRVDVNAMDVLSDGELAIFEPQGSRVALQAAADSTLLVLNGEPIDEPIAGYGPFVMNTPDEIRQAKADFGYI